MNIRVKTRVVGKDNRGRNNPIKGMVYYYCIKGKGRRGV